jgi:hypothetical protein
MPLESFIQLAVVEDSRLASFLERNWSSLRALVRTEKQLDKKDV